MDIIKTGIDVLLVSCINDSNTLTIGDVYEVLIYQNIPLENTYTIGVINDTGIFAKYDAKTFSMVYIKPDVILNDPKPEGPL